MIEYPFKNNYVKLVNKIYLKCPLKCQACSSGAGWWCRTTHRKCKNALKSRTIELIGNLPPQPKLL